MDYPHHYGIWFNHGIVNEIDFGTVLSFPEPNVRYGESIILKFLKVESGEKGILEVEKEWRSDKDELVLKEQTTYVFSGDSNTRLITHITSISALRA